MTHLRWFMMYLAIVAGIVLTTPAFWAIVGMRVGASPVVYQNHDGSFQPATIGPKSQWPEWAIAPESASLKVVSWFGPSAMSKASGMGEITYGDEPRAAAGAYVDALRTAGWEVETGRYEGAMPVIPPRNLVLCQVRAKLDGRMILATFEIAPHPGKGTIFWVDAPSPGLGPQPLQSGSGTC